MKEKNDSLDADEFERARNFRLAVDSAVAALAETYDRRPAQVRGALERIMSERYGYK